MTKHTSTLILALALAGRAHAWLFAPTGSDSVVTPWFGDVDEAIYDLPSASFLPGFQLFGAMMVGDIQACSNGYAGWTTSAVYNNIAFPNATLANTIAPFWDDLYATGLGPFANSKSIRAANPAFGVYVITWQGWERFQQASTNFNFQIALYGAGNVLGVAANTIAINYDVMNGSTGNSNAASIGLNKGDGTTVYLLPVAGSAGPNFGQTQSQLDLVQNKTWTFTPNGTGGYSVTAGAPVPEPATGFALLAGASLAVRRRPAPRP